MEVIIETAGNVAVAQLSGELDHHSAAEVREQIDKTMERSSAKHLILDFGGVTFMDSSGIGVVFGRYKKIKDAGGKVVIIGCIEPIRNILNMAGVFSIVDYMDSRKAGLEFLRRKDVV